MEKIIINGGAKLKGEVDISGSKNSVVALIPAAILCKDKVRIYNYPRISDVEVLIDILKDLNVKVHVNKEYLEIDSSRVINTSLTNVKMSKLRASYYFMGALLALFNHVDIIFPGGCDIGPRPINLHMDGFKLLNCDVTSEGDLIHMHSEAIKGNKIVFDKASVGATINIMLASVFAKGETIIENSAREPEVEDLANFLNKMGARIEGAGTSTIKITGVTSLKGTEHTVIPDRIEAGTYVLIGAACAEELTINHVNPNHLKALIKVLKKCNVTIDVRDDKIIVSKPNNLRPINISTDYYPGFPTDLQQILTALMTQADGTSLITEAIYESRFKNCDELLKMGANIEIYDRTVMINGKTLLLGKDVSASDLRGGASLILAGLVAKGITTIHNVEHIFRGYGNIVSNLKKINANITVIEQ